MRASMVCTAALALLTLGLGSARADGAGVNDGEWEVTTQMTIPGMPVAIPPVTRTQCLTKKNAVPKPSPQQGSCEISAIKSDGNKVSWTIKCSGPRAAQGSGEITYSGDTMQGKSTFTMKNPRSGEDVTATQTITGTRVGDCRAPRPHVVT